MPETITIMGNNPRKSVRHVLRGYKRTLKRILKIREFLKEGIPYVIYNFEHLMSLLQDVKPKKHVIHWKWTRQKIMYDFSLEVRKLLKYAKGNTAQNIMFKVFPQLRTSSNPREYVLNGLDYYDFAKEIEKHNKYVVAIDTGTKYQDRNITFYLLNDASCICVDKMPDANIQVYMCGKAGDFMFAMFDFIDKFGTYIREFRQGSECITSTEGTNG